MDEVLERLAHFADGLTAAALDAAAIHEVKRRLVDSFGCIVGGCGSEPARIARRLAGQSRGALAATAVGLSAKTTVELAAFANTVMVRYLDYNDMYFTPRGGGQHPSDLIPAVLAVGEALGARGVDVLVGIVAAYEIGAALAGVARIRERGWDQGTFTVVAAAMGAGKLLGLSREQLAHAASVAVTSNIATRQTRVGHLSMWKGSATAAANRNGIFAALLAREGMTGPDAPFVGKDGIMDLITGRFTLELPLPHPRPFAAEASSLKFYPSEYNSQSALDVVLALRPRVPLDEIEDVCVETYWLAYSEIGMEPAKWDPRTRETADHSLPYLLAAALLDGGITPRSFTDARIADPVLRRLMQRISVIERKDFSERFPDELNARIVIRLRSGATVEGQASHPHGHAKDPLTDDEVNEKCDALCASSPDRGLCRELKDALWAFERLDDVSPVIAALGRLTAAGAG